MKGKFYQDIVRIFYTKLFAIRGVLILNIKGLEILIDEYVWVSIAELKIEWDFTSDLKNINNFFFVYLDCLRDLVAFQSDNTKKFKTKGMKINEIFRNVLEFNS